MAIKRSISIAKGKGSIGHNSRTFQAENIDAGRTPYNIAYCNEPVKEVYHQLFDEALERYNAKQKRNDRKIPDYYEKIRTAKQEKLFYEIVVQVGNCEDMSATSQHGKLAEKILNEYMTEFQQRNPSLYVFSAHLHMDEATPHLHIDFVPYTSGNTRGLETKTTLKGALKQLGFTGGTRSDTELTQWQNAEKEKLAEIMLAHGIKWEKKDTRREHLSVLDYKKQERTKEVAALEEKSVEMVQSISEKQSLATSLKVEISKEKQEFQSIQTKKTKLKKVDEIAVKPALLDSGKVVVARSEFEDVKILAKKQIVDQRKEKTLSAKNAELSMENQALRKENTALANELYEYKSIKNQLSVKQMEVKLQKLERLFARVMAFVEKLGLKKQLDKFLQDHKNHER